jgi:hypothetical protein
MVEGEVVGLLEVFSANRSHFQAGDYDLLQRLTPLIAASLQRPEPAKPVLDGWAVHERGILFSPESGPAPEKSDGKSEPGIPVPRSHLVLLTAAAALIALVLGYVLAPWIQDKFQTRVAPRQDASNSTRISSPPPIPNTLEELRKAAEQGDTNAQFALGSRYATGEDVPQDYAQAAQWFNSAAEKGHVVAQATLAAYYWSGLGVPKDITKAYFWSILARAGGDEGSKFRAAALTSHMTRPQVLAAQQQADEWLRKHQLGPAPGSNP